MRQISYTLAQEVDRAPRMGLIVLQTDETVEADIQALIPRSSARLHITRIPSGAQLTPETIGRMTGDMSAAADLLPAVDFDVIAYACTSGTTLIGADAVARKVRAGRACRDVTNPLTAAIAAAQALKARKLAIVSPYIASVAEPVSHAFQAAGLEVSAAVTFGEMHEARVARIEGGSIRAAAHELVQETVPDALFLSCTNLVTLDLIDMLEAETGVPVLSSNQVLSWHMCRLAGVPPATDAPGRLFQV